MNINVARSLAAFGVAGALILGSSVPALAAEDDATIDGKLMGAVTRTLNDAALASGSAIDAQSYLGNFDEPSNGRAAVPAPTASATGSWARAARMAAS